MSKARNQKYSIKANKELHPSCITHCITGSKKSALINTYCNDSRADSKQARETDVIWLKAFVSSVKVMWQDWNFWQTMQV